MALEYKTKQGKGNRVLLENAKMKQGKGNRVLLRERTGHRKHPLPTTQEKTLHIDIIKWSITKSD